MRMGGEAGRRRDVEVFVSQYDGEILYTDGWLKTTLGHMAETGLSRDNTVFVISADHGEEFRERHPDDRGGNGHGRTLYLEQIHVPFLLLAPGLSARRVSTWVELTDVTPTVLDLDRMVATARAVFQQVDLYEAGRNWVLIAHDGAAKTDAQLRDRARQLQRAHALRYPLEPMLAQRRAGVALVRAHAPAGTREVLDELTADESGRPGDADGAHGAHAASQDAAIPRATRCAFAMSVKL